MAPHIHGEHERGFWRHFVEMLVAMAIGMFAGLAIFLSVVGMTFEQAIVRHPSLILFVMAVSMTVPMVGWMRYRGHAWRACFEMAAAMIVPMIPFLLLVLFDVTKSALCGAYCALTVPAMLAVMFYRRTEYTHWAGGAEVPLLLPDGAGARADRRGGASSRCVLAGPATARVRGRAVR